MDETKTGTTNDDKSKQTTTPPAAEPAEDFDGAWKEANEGKPTVTGDAGDAGDPPTVDDPTKVAGAADTTVDDPSKKKPAEPGGTDEPPADPTEKPVSRQDYEALEQRMKSWEGRLGATSRENEGLKKERDDLAKKLAEIEQEIKSGNATAAETDAELEALQKEYPDYTKKFMPIVQRMVDNAKKAAEQEVDKRVHEAMEKHVKPLESKAKKADEDAHFKAITDKHPDFAEVAASPDMQRWLASRPAYMQPALRQVIRGGTPVEVIGLVDDFKLAMKTEADAKKRAAAELEAKRKTQAKNAGAVNSHTGGVSTKLDVDENDFDGEWERLNKA